MVITEDGKLFPNVVDDKNLNCNDVIITDGHNDSVEITKVIWEIIAHRQFINPSYRIPIFSRIVSLKVQNQVMH